MTREAGTLVSLVVHGIVALCAPDCSACHFWVGALDRTFSATLDGEINVQSGMVSTFMRAVANDPDKSKLNVAASNVRVLASSSNYSTPADHRKYHPEQDSSDDEQDQNISVLVLAAAGAWHCQKTHFAGSMTVPVLHFTKGLLRACRTLC